MSNITGLAAIQPGAPFGQNAILQQQTEAPVWGTAEAGETVVVTLREESVEAVADDAGKWLVRIPTGEAGGPFDLTISPKSDEAAEPAVTLQVWVGEVWLAGGQSNMWWAVGKSVDREKQNAEAAEFPVHYWESHNYRGEGTLDWEIAAPGKIDGWASVAYNFGRRLSQELGVPVGIIHTAVAGQSIQTFMAPDLLENSFPHELLAWNWDDQEVQEVRRPELEKKRAEWEAAGKPAGQEPQLARGIQKPSYLWFKHVAPVVPYKVRGFIWWQGENGSAQPLPYRALFMALIQDWRVKFEVRDAPFYYAELHNAWGEQDYVQDAPWPAQREAQRDVQKLLHNVYPVNALDISDPESDPAYPNETHPANKPKMGNRMAVRALHEVYSRPATVWASPRITSADFSDDGTVTLQIWQAGEGLTTKDGEPPKGFFLADNEGKWHRAEATLHGDSIQVRSDSVPQPIALRYAWANNPVHNVVNSIGNPLGSWRSDDWQIRGDD